MDFQDIIVNKENGIEILIINRPSRYNSLTFNTLTELRDAFVMAGQDDEIKVIILTGAGDQAFSAGADAGTLGGLADERSSSQERNQKRWEMIEPIGNIASHLDGLRKPVLAAINGVAAGAGLSLALLCDIRLAAEDARFTLAFVKRGLIPDCGATYTLPRIVGKTKALELMWLGDIIDAREAERVGLVSWVVPKQKLMKKAMTFAHRLAEGPSVAIELTKWAVQKSLKSDLERQLDFESRAQQICTRTRDFKEGVQSFIEKREAHFQGR